MPTRPSLEQLVEVAARRHRLLEIVQREAFALKARRAVLALAVGALHRDLEIGELRALRGILGSWQRDSDLEQMHLAREIGRQGQAIEARGFFDDATEVGHVLFLG